MLHKKKLFFIFIPIGLITILIVLILSIVCQNKKATLNLFVLPEQATILINGKQYTNGSYYFSPGEIEVTISKENFQTQTFTTELKSNSTTLIYKLLYCQDTSLVCYLESDYESDFNLIPFISHYTENEQQTISFYKAASIVNILPLHYEAHSDDYSQNYYFTIQLGDTSGDKIPLEVTDFYNNSQKIITQIITDSGYNIDDYQINYNKSSLMEIQMKEKK